MQKSSRAGESRSTQPAAMWNMAPPAIDAMAKTYAMWLNQASRLRDEALRFAQERLNKGLEAAAELSRCTSPSDALAVQADFANTMAADYLTESKRIVELVGDLAKEASALPESRKPQH